MESRACARAWRWNGSQRAGEAEGKAIMMADSRGGCGGGDNRRAFLKSAAAAGGAAALASAEPAWADAPPGHAAAADRDAGQDRPEGARPGDGDELGRCRPASCQAALHAGVRYIDTSETYEGGNCEKTLGEVLERTKMRKDVYLVTKNSGGKVGGSKAFRHFREAS